MGTRKTQKAGVHMSVDRAPLNTLGRVNGSLTFPKQIPGTCGCVKPGGAIPSGGLNLPGLGLPRRRATEEAKRFCHVRLQQVAAQAKGEAEAWAA